jgi:hypothetical protein
MLMALLLSFDKWKEREEPKAAGSQHRYFRQASVGYAVGLVTALAAGVLMRSAQPALLYLVSMFCIPLHLVRFRSVSVLILLYSCQFAWCFCHVLTRHLQDTGGEPNLRAVEGHGI